MLTIDYTIVKCIFEQVKKDYKSKSFGQLVTTRDK